MKRSAAVRVARVYDQPGADDGARVLVDRLWPRGLRKDDLVFDEWCQEVAPSAELRRWYGHDPQRFAEFAQRYRLELADPDRSAIVTDLVRRARRGGLTLLTATKLVELSQAAVLAELIESMTA